MAGILQNVFSKGIYTLKDPENVSKLKTLVNHSALYFGLIVYTAIGAKVFQILEYPAELEEKEVSLASLETSRQIFLNTVTNKTLSHLGRERFTEIVNKSLEKYEIACAEASEAGVDIIIKVNINKMFSVNILQIHYCGRILQ